MSMSKITIPNDDDDDDAVVSAANPSRRLSLQRSGRQRFQSNNPTRPPMNMNSGSIRSFYIRNRVREEHAPSLQKLKEMQRHLERAGESGTNPHTKDMKEAEEILDLISNLRGTNRQNKIVIQSLQQQLAETEAQFQKSNEKEVDHWKNKYKRLEKDNYQRIEKIAATALLQVTVRSKISKAEVDGWKDRDTRCREEYDELVENIAALAEENGQLLTRCEQLEEEDNQRKDELALIEDVYAENSILHQSMNEAVQLVSKTEGKMASFVRVHVASVNSYEEQLTSLKDGQAGGIIMEGDDANALRVQLASLKKEKDEAYLTCEVLQEELDLLRRSSGQESKGGGKDDHGSLLHSFLDADSLLDSMESAGENGYFLDDDDESVGEDRLTRVTEGDEDCEDECDSPTSKDKPSEQNKEPKNCASWKDHKKRLTRFTSAYKNLTAYCLSDQEEEPPEVNPKAHDNTIRTPTSSSRTNFEQRRPSLTRSTSVNNHRSILAQFGGHGLSVSDLMAIAAEAESEATSKIQSSRFESMARY